MIYLYALTDVKPFGFLNLGLDEQPVRSMTCAGLHFVHSEHAEGLELVVTPRALWTHEAVVEELLERGAVLPFRFGTTLPDHPFVAAIAGAYADAFRATLAELRGRVELAVRIGLPETAADPTVVLEALDSLAAASRHAEADQSNVIRASYLVDRDEVADFASVVRELQEHHPELSVSCTGPWAPYSFAVEAGT